MNEAMAVGATRSATTGRRREIRIPVRLLATIAAPGKAATSVEIRDLSRGGACCRTALPPAIGSALELRLDGLSVPALVCWVAGSRIGLRFLQPLRASDILIQSGRSRATGGHDHPLHVQVAPRALRHAG